MKINPHFPLNTLYLMRGAIVAQREGFLDNYNQAMFEALWVNEENLADPQVVGEVLAAAGIDAPALLDAIQRAEVKQALIKTTKEAVSRGVFGMPAIFINDELFFGQDRLPFVEMALKAAQKEHRDWISPTRAQFKAYASHPEADSRPVIMINLLKYDGAEGKSTYMQKYGIPTTQMVKNVGGRVIWSGEVAQLLAGDTRRNDWDAAILVEYPSRNALISMMKNPAYQALHAYREAGLADTALIAAHELMRDLA